MSSFLDGSLFYVTRPTADGQTGSVYCSIWMQSLVLILVWLNIVGWSVYGLVELGSKVL